MKQVWVVIPNDKDNLQIRLFGNEPMARTFKDTAKIVKATIEECPMIAIGVEVDEICKHCAEGREVDNYIVCADMDTALDPANKKEVKIMSNCTLSDSDNKNCQHNPPIRVKCPFCDEVNFIDRNTLELQFCKCSSCSASFGIQEALRHS